MILADVVRVPGRPVATVRLRVTAPAGLRTTVTAVSQGESWVAGVYLSDGGVRVLADPLAPLGAPVAYAATHGSTVEWSSEVTRPSPGACAITSLDGTVGALTEWYGDDQQEPEVRVHELPVHGASLPIHNRDLVAGAGGGALVAQTHGPSTEAMARLVALNGPVVLLHDEAGCEIPGCDIPPWRVVILTSARNARTVRVERATRAHSLTYRYTARDDTVLAPVVTVGDYQQSGLTVGDLAAYTVADVAAGVPLVSVL